MAEKRGRFFRPYEFSRRLLQVLILCALFACVAALLVGYTYSRASVRSELVADQLEAAQAMVDLRERTDLPLEDLLDMSGDTDLTITIVAESDVRLSNEQWTVLNAQNMVTDTGNVIGVPVTYLRLDGQLISISPGSGVNVFMISILRIALTVIAYLLVMSVVGILAMRRATRPINRLVAATRRVQNGDFDVRVQEDEPGEMGELIRTFNSMTETLGKTSYLQKDFIASISHEFKTPIASIRGFARLLQMPDLSEEQRNEYVELIATESDRLSRMSQTLLRLVALEQQTAPVSVNRYQLDEQLREVIVNMAPAWESREIDWQLELEEVAVTSDEELLRQVWVNLIQNAVKFSDKGGVIRIATKADGDQAVVEVEDHGIGMDEETLKRIFDRFYQADRSRSREGIGLGLSLVRRIVDILGGTVTVTSVPGEGTTFRVVLPLGGGARAAKG